jgi:hypothetical protein
MSTEKFMKKFSKQLDQRETRDIVRKRGRTRLALGSFALLQYLVNCAWGNGKRRQVTVSTSAMQGGSGLSYRAIRYNLDCLIEHGLITQTEKGIAVHCEPMLDWQTNKQASAAKAEKVREQARAASAAYRARKAMNAAVQDAESEIQHIIKQAEREGQ